MGADDVSEAECNVKRWNLRGYLRPWPISPEERFALSRLERAGVIAWVRPTATSLGGFHWVGVSRSRPSAERRSELP